MTGTSAIESYKVRAAREHWPTQCDPELDFEAESLAGLLAIWRGVRADRPLPQRRDFSARVLKRHLADIAFLERTPARRYRVGFFGSGLARRMGDLTGRHLDEVIPPDQIGAWHAGYDTVLAAAQPLRFVSQIRAFRLDHMMAESFVAPLAGDDRTASALLVSAVYRPRIPAGNTQSLRMPE